MNEMIAVLQSMQNMQTANTGRTNRRDTESIIDFARVLQTQSGKYQQAPKQKKMSNEEVSPEAAAMAALNVNPMRVDNTVQDTEATDQAVANVEAVDMETEEVSMLIRPNVPMEMDEALEMLAALLGLPDGESVVDVLTSMGIELPEGPITFADVIQVMLAQMNGKVEITQTEIAAEEPTAPMEAMDGLPEMQQEVALPEQTVFDAQKTASVEGAVEDGQEIPVQEQPATPQQIVKQVQETLEATAKQIEENPEEPLVIRQPQQAEQAEESITARPTANTETETDANTDEKPVEVKKTEAAPQTAKETPEVDVTVGAMDVATVKVSDLRAQVQELTLQPVNREAIVQNIAQAVSLMNNNNGASTLQIQLAPEHLGKITVILHASREEGVAAQIKAPNEHVRSMLSGGLGELTEALKGLGVNMKNIEVTESKIAWDFSRGGQQRQDQQDSSGEQTARRYRPVSTREPRLSAVERMFASTPAPMAGEDLAMDLLA